MQYLKSLARDLGAPTQSPEYPLAVIRIVLGLWFLFDAIRFAILGGEWNDSVAGFLANSADNEQVWLFYKSFINALLLPNADSVALFVLFSFFVVGIGLTAGIMTRFFALLGLFLNLNFVMARGYGFLGAHIDAWFVIAEIAILFSTVGLTFGLDGLLARTRSGKTPDLSAPE